MKRSYGRAAPGGVRCGVYPAMVYLPFVPVLPGLDFVPRVPDGSRKHRKLTIHHTIGFDPI